MTARDERGVLDTDVIILLERLDVAALPSTPLITAISLAELSAGPIAATDDEERAIRQTRLQQVEASFDPLPLDAAAARAFGSVATALRRSGRRPAARAFGALIAATAIANEMPVYTCNEKDFVGIPRLTVRPVRHPERR